ncbi:MAG: hypothetical protein V4719_30235 [Planctomycetota bacterium]
MFGRLVEFNPTNKLPGMGQILPCASRSVIHSMIPGNPCLLV